jgi:hypothetical protein
MGEYANVHFFFPYSAPVIHGNIYVAGGYNCWQYDKDNRKTYNYSRHGYEATVKFKQGYYNYLYTFLPNNSEAGDVTYIEGSHFETENNYTITGVSPRTGNGLRPAYCCRELQFGEITRD